MSMSFQPSKIYHVYNQGNNRQRIFCESKDYVRFLDIYRKEVVPFTNTIAWCLMPNHFHLMIHNDNRCCEKIKQGSIFIDPVTNGIRKMLSFYAQKFNQSYSRTGSLFRQKTKAKCLSEIEIISDGIYPVQDYVTNCFHYIHQNPEAAGLVKNSEDWEFSSYRDYLGIRKETICRIDLAEKFCGYQPADFRMNSGKPVDSDLLKFFAY